MGCVGHVGEDKYSIEGKKQEQCLRVNDIFHNLNILSCYSGGRCVAQQQERAYLALALLQSVHETCARVACCSKMTSTRNLSIPTALYVPVFLVCSFTHFVNIRLKAKSGCDVFLEIWFNSIGVLEQDNLNTVFYAEKRTVIKSADPHLMSSYSGQKRS